MVGCQAAFASRLTPTEKQSSPDSPHAFHHSNGRVSARRKLLILPCRPLRQAEWRGSSGGGSAATVWRSQTHREEVQRSKPEAMRPDESRSEGTRATARAVRWGQRPLLPLGRLPKGVAVRAKPPAAAPEATDIHPKPQEPGRPRGRQVKAENAQPSP